MRHPRSLIALLFALSLAACATTPFETPGVLPPAAYPADGSPQRSALNAKVYDKAVRHVDRLFHRKDFDRTAFAAEATADGTVLEKIGVTPDIDVATDWLAVRAGRDPTLEQARALLASPPEDGALDQTLD